MIFLADLFAQEEQKSSSPPADTIVVDYARVEMDSIARVASADTVPAGLDAAVSGILDNLAGVTFYQMRSAVDSQYVNPYGYERGFVPVFHDTVYEQRIRELNRETAFEISFNRQVKKFIDLYAGKRRGLTERMLGISTLYFPLFEEHLDKHGLPLELKYLAVVESALNPTAVSRAGAKGMWQFMYGTGRLYGLKENSVIDDRFDVLKSTDAACRHMKDLYAIYGDWALVLAAYNSGAGNVNKAIRRSGGMKNYWLVWPFLPSETRGYVPAFIAVAYLMNHFEEHNLVPECPGFSFSSIDTVMTNDVVSLEQIAEYLSIPLKDLTFLNPAYKIGIIPSTKENKYPLHLPVEFVDGFIDNEKEIYTYKTSKGIEKEKLLAEIKKAGERNIHIVRSGESLSVIASKYRTSINNLRNWNNLKGNTIYPGQKLVVYASGVVRNTDKKQEDAQRSARANKAVDKKPIENLKQVEPGYHIVRQGDTLWDIARLYSGVTIEDIRKLNNMGKSSKLKIGQRLIIPANN